MFAIHTTPHKAYRSFNACVGATATMNAADKSSTLNVSGTTISSASVNGTHALGRATHSITSQKAYLEFQVSSIESTCVDIIGFQDGGVSITTPVGNGGQGFGRGYASNAGQNYGSGWSTSSPPALVNGVYGIAIDGQEGLAWLREPGGTWFNSGNPITKANPTWIRSSSKTPLYPAASFFNSTASVTFNFGALAFSYAIPSV